MRGAQIAPAALEFPVRQFSDNLAARHAISVYESGLWEAASRWRAAGQSVADQDYPDAIFRLTPPEPVLPPLAILGGMGPLAGAKAFREACNRFGDSRAVALYQACSLPDRTQTILAADEKRARDLAAAIGQAARKAVGLLPPGRFPACIVSCNSAHYFWPEIETLAAPLCRLVSLVAASLEALRNLPGKTLLLTTKGARAGQVFSRPFRKARIDFDEPAEAADGLLMAAIYEGVKALDDGRAVALGNEFFEAILKTGTPYCRILAGCTEIPTLIDLLKRHGRPAVAAFLSGVEILDPLREALARV